MAPPSDAATQNTPLAPSVEKAYYRKCIELKRRLNEVEASNDELKTKRVRLDRSIMKMRLERAFLLDELRKRMDNEMADSDGSGDDGINTPPPDRPHRDKRRRQQHPQQSMPPPASATLPSQPEGGPRNMVMYMPPGQTPQSTGPPPYQAPPPQSSPYGAPVGVPGAADRQMNGSGAVDSTNERPPSHETPINRGAGATGEALSAGPAITELSNGDRRVASPSSADNANADAEKQDNPAESDPAGAGTRS